MVRINLLSPSEKKKAGGLRAPMAPRIGMPSSVPLPLLGGGFLLLLLAGAVFLYVDQNRRLGELDERIETARQDSTRHSRAITKIKQIETSQSAIAARIQAIQEVDRGRFRSAHILEELSRALPEYTWLTSVVRSEQPADPTLA